MNEDKKSVGIPIMLATMTDHIVDVRPPPRRSMRAVVVKIVISPIVEKDKFPPAIVTSEDGSIRYETYSPAVRGRFLSHESTLYFEAEIGADDIIEIGNRVVPKKSW